MLFSALFYFYFFWWGISILRALKEKKKISAFSIIDVTLSMNKIISGDFFQTPYKEGFDKLNTLLNRIISERFLTVFFENPKLYGLNFFVYLISLTLWTSKIRRASLEILKIEKKIVIIKGL